MSELESEQLRVLREILKWIRFTGMKEVKGALIAALDTDQKKIIYQLSDGEKSSRDISKATGVSDRTVRNYWKIWSRIGIVEAIKAGTRDRYERSFDLEDLGIEVPRLITTRHENEGSSEPGQKSPLASAEQKHAWCSK